MPEAYRGQRTDAKTETDLRVLRSAGTTRAGLLDDASRRANSADMPTSPPLPFCLALDNQHPGVRPRADAPQNAEVVAVRLAARRLQREMGIHDLLCVMASILVGSHPSVWVQPRLTVSVQAPLLRSGMGIVCVVAPTHPIGMLHPRSPTECGVRHPPPVIRPDFLSHVPDQMIRAVMEDLAPRGSSRETVVHLGAGLLALAARAWAAGVGACGQTCTIRRQALPGGGWWDIGCDLTEIPQTTAPG